MAKAFVEVRSKHAVGTWPKKGPDTYVAVQIVPEGVERLKVLNHNHAAKRGIIIKHFGDGYSNRCATNRSMLGRALEKAVNFATKFNSQE